MIDIKKLDRNRLGCVIIFVLVFVVYFVSSFDVCWVNHEAEGYDKGFVFDVGWSEHLHSSEEWTIFYQVKAFDEGRVWLSEGSPPPLAGDVYRIGDMFYAYAEPMTAAFMLPFFKVGEALLGDGWLIRSVIVGMMVVTCLNALLIREIVKQLKLNVWLATFAAFLFAFCTMACSYSRLLYPQPVVCLLALASVLFLFRYRKSHKREDLLGLSAFFGFTVFSFNAFLVTAPLFVVFLFRNGFKVTGRRLMLIMLGFVPSILLFTGWNYVVTGNPFVTLRQYIYPSLSFQVLYPSDNGVWLNVEGLFGQLFSPAGIFFVSSILFASLFGFSILKRKAKEETVFLTLLIVVFWLFMSFAAHPGDVTGRDFWVGGWASISRYMYLPSAFLAVFSASVFEVVYRERRVVVAWVLSLLTVISFLANVNYGIHRDLMVGETEGFISKSLILYPYHLSPNENTVFILVMLLASAVFPFMLTKWGMWLLERLRRLFV